MGKKWDYDVPSVEIWQEVLRVLKPGGYLLSFAGTRTQHRMAVRIEDAGFEIRDMIFWTYASGFPKSLNIEKQLNKLCTCENRDVQRLSDESEAKHNLRLVSGTDLPQAEPVEEEQGEVLQSSLSQQGTQEHRGTGAKPKTTRTEQPSMERRGNLETPKRELQGSDLPAMSKTLFTDGEERLLHSTAQASNGSTPKQITETNGSGASQRPQPQQQPNSQPCAFCLKWGTQEVRRAREAFKGFGTALKPACEPITVARKPLSEKSVAENCLKWGVGGINIDGCRVDYNGETPNLGGRGKHTRGEGYGFKALGEELEANTQGRFPANLIHDGSDEVVSLFPNTKGELHNKQSSGNSMFLPDNEGSKRGYSIKDTGSAARFFYCAKASKSERNKGCEELEERIGENGNKWTDQDYRRGDIIPNTTRKNFHPTVKPIALMEYLVKLVTKPNHIVIDPFTGSGSTLIACKNLGRNYIGIERESEYCKIAETRLAAVKPLPVLF